MKRTRGFTLIEVLVALGVVALTLTTGLQASSALTRTAERQTEQWLATLCAENALTALRLQRQLPGTGDTETVCEQAGRALRVRVSVLPTPNPNFRRVDATVIRGTDATGTRLLTLSTVQGRY
ncbi:MULTISPECIES: type II secretion system minor pseudopilin GspI [Hydrogenophaga]|jgi:general secretion pathway protein I|uniref:Type II secretion system protein I n=1 Tax=Hydrogenophaga intermedia TaxID=65786 RepID=A0A1L1P9H0_HYDIT|nr:MULTISPECIES: type II secretion system minor pseudopilin GspI [Hydrogenophaga]AOS77837.1 type II secretion system protein GspI [Hydrogenophaga sp. PBC]TMU75989.1 type II secretion system protein GspI [Hydrogenophaga intermedia]CDN85940.1 General secretion pathway protein I [Hydrogenophaga intermedia]